MLPCIDGSDVRDTFFAYIVKMCSHVHVGHRLRHQTLVHLTMTSSMLIPTYVFFIVPSIVQAHDLKHSVTPFRSKLSKVPSWSKIKFVSTWTVVTN